MSRSRHVSGENNLADRVQRLEAQVAELQKANRGVTSQSKLARSALTIAMEIEQWARATKDSK